MQKKLRVLQLERSSVRRDGHFGGCRKVRETNPRTGEGRPTQELAKGDQPKNWRKGDQPKNWHHCMQRCVFHVCQVRREAVRMKRISVRIELVKLRV